jgi:hypothetical protein
MVISSRQLSKPGERLQDLCSRNWAFMYYYRFGLRELLFYLD